jgi:cell division protease FtsH
MDDVQKENNLKKNIQDLQNDGETKDTQAAVFTFDLKFLRKWGWGIVIVLLVIYALSNVSQYIYPKSPTYTEIANDVADSKIQNLELCNGYVTAKYSDNTSKKTYYNGNFEEYLRSKDKGRGLDLDQMNIKIDSCEPGQDVASILNIILMLIVIVLAVTLGWRFMKTLNDNGSRMMGMGESKAKFIYGKKQDITLADVAGIEEAKDELNEIVLFLKDPKRFEKVGARIPKGIMMFGAPGTGKTLLARAIAGEAKVPFFSTSGSEFEEMLVGAGASRVRDLFAKAKKVAPALIFIDEIDAIGKKRGTSINSNATDQTLNQILVEMDGFEKNQNIIVIAATNRPDVLDPALLRPGRFDRKIMLDLPDQDGRFAILQIHAKNKPLGKDIDLAKLAKRTIGFSGADLENVLNEAAIAAGKDNRLEILEKDVEEATLKVVMGSARNRKRTDKELDMTAYHEAGHAVVSKFVPEADPVHKITIVSRGQSAGMTMYLPEVDEMQVTQTKMLSKIKTLQAGQLAEKIFCGDITAGASSDIERATKIAYDMIRKYGMSSNLGTIKYGYDDDDDSYSRSKNYSEKTAEFIDSEVQRIIKSCYIETENIILKNRDKIEELKLLLRKQEIVSSEEFERLF